MARIIVDGINAPQLQAQSVGRVQTNTVGAPSGGAKLLDALAKGGSSIAKGFAKLQDVNNKADESAADAYFNSMTLEEIGKKVKNGELPPDASPVFSARVEHNYGANYLAQLSRDAEEKLLNGEFTAEGQDPVKAFDEYLTESRNGFLEGASKYTTAGFDKQFNAVKTRFQDTIAKQASAERMMAAQGSVTETLVNIVGNNEATDAFGVKALKAGTVGAMVAEYKNQATQLNLSKENRKGVLASMAEDLVGRGDKEALAEFLDTKLDNGISVGSVISGKNPAKLRQMRNMAREQERVKNREQAETWHDKFTQQVERGELDIEEFTKVRPRFEPYMDFGDLVARNEAKRASFIKEADKQERVYAYNSAVQAYSDAADAAVVDTITTGAIPNAADRVVTKPTGASETLKWEDEVKKAIDVRTEGDIETRARTYAAYGFTDDKTKRELNQLSSGIFNTVNPDGTLPEDVLERFEIFRTYNATNPAYTKELMGSNYETVRDFDIFRRMGDSPEQAASTLRLVQQSSMANADVSTRKMAEAVDTRMMEINDRGIFSNVYTRLFGSQEEKDLFLGSDAMYGNGEISAAVRKRAKGLYLSGQAGSVDEAIQSSMSGVLKSGAVVKANEQLYWREDLPSRLPENMEPPEAMEVYRRALVSTFEKAGLSYEEDNIMLVPNRNGSFTVKVRGSDGSIAIPLVKGKRMEPTLKMVEAYMESRQKRLDAERIQENRRTKKRVDALDLSFAP